MSVTFSYPVTSPTESMTLNLLQLGEPYSTDFGLIVRNNRHNEVRVVYDSNWPISRTKQLTFRGISYSQKTVIEIFLDTVQGMELKYTDTNLDEWIGYITNSSFEFVNQYKNCGYSLLLEFIGELTS